MRKEVGFCPASFYFSKNKYNWMMNKIITLTGLVFILFSCNSSRKYDITRYHSQETIDTLLVNMVTLIGVKPKTADWQTRHLPQHRKHYVQIAKQFSFDRYYISPEGVHYFFMVRPARHARGNQRGVGGKFRMNENLELYEFEELFNTPVMPYDQIIAKGREIFAEMINTGNVDNYVRRKDFIEWPDDRLKYDKQKNEWRYDVVD